MRYNEIKEKDYLGVPTPSVEEIAKKHNVPVAMINHQLAKGRKVEREHINVDKIAAEIARDHLAELPDYYDRLEKMEKGITEEGEADSTYRQLRILFGLAKEKGLFDAADWLHDKLSDMAKEMRY